MPIAAAVATIGSTVIGGIASNQAAKTAAKGAQGAANTAAQTELGMFNRNEARLAPFTSTGTSALSQLAAMFGFGPGGTGTPNAQAAMSQLQQFPGYEFGRDQGVQALDRSAASRGLLRSGAQLQDVQKFGTDYAMQQAWAPYVSGLQYASTLGENAAAGTGTLGAAAAGQAGAAQLQGGLDAASARGNGIANVGNVLSSGLQQYALQQQQQQQMFGGGGGGGFSPMSVQSGGWQSLGDVASGPAASLSFAPPITYG